MTRRRFFAPPEAFDQPQQTVQLDQAETRHLRNVLRLRAGDEVFVFDGLGHEFRCLVTDASGKTGSLTVAEPTEPASRESPLHLTLAVALLKGEKFDLVVQKATELGVTRIVPVVTARSDVRVTKDATAARRVERWNRLALEAAKQSGRAFVPECDEPAEFLKFVSREDGNGATRLMFTERGGAGLASAPKPDGATLIALVGPEGGWADDEMDQARSNGWTLITLGGRILRAETAAITVVALLQHRFGDLL
jgi:16S rRNA (uracil1498-N3)-methyltransferase